MTRTDDSSKSNNDRYTFCNNEQATILVSVHTNSSSDSTFNGSCDSTLNVEISDSHTIS